MAPVVAAAVLLWLVTKLEVDPLRLKVVDVGHAPFKPLIASVRGGVTELFPPAVP